MVMRKTPSPKQKKVIVKHMVKDAKRLRSAYAKGKKKKFQAARPIERGDDRRRSEGRHMTPWAFAREGLEDHHSARCVKPPEI
jgi:hypothetical protein